MGNNRRIVIRPATPDDIGQVRSLLVATWHDTHDGLLGVEQVHGHDRPVARPGCAGNAVNASERLVPGGAQDDEGVGHAFAVEQGGGVLLLSRLYVLPARQRQGIGEGLLRAALGRHPGTTRVQLVVEAGNAKALAFYGRHGFVATGEIEEEGRRSCRMEVVVDDGSVPRSEPAGSASGPQGCSSEDEGRSTWS